MRAKPSKRAYYCNNKKKRKLNNTELQSVADNIKIQKRQTYKCETQWNQH